MDSANPYAPPAADLSWTGASGYVASANAFGPERFSTTAEAGKPGEQTWRIGFHDEGIVLHDPDGDSEPITREQFVADFDVTPTGKITLLRWESRKKQLQLDADATTALRRWAMPDLERWCSAVARRRFEGRLIMGLIFAAVAGFEWFVGGVGVLLPLFAVGGLTMGLGAKFRPGRWLFAFSGVYLIVFASIIGLDVAFAGRHWAWLALCLFFAFVVPMNFRKFGFFRE